MHAIVFLITLVALLATALPVLAEGEKHHKVVNSTAYNSPPIGSKKKNKTTACADKLDPKQEYARTVAVSPDLVKEGLVCGSALKIEGVEGDLIVNDFLPKKARNRIDIYLGREVKDAKGWGRRKVTISW